MGKRDGYHVWMNDGDRRVLVDSVKSKDAAERTVKDLNKDGKGAIVQKHFNNPDAK